MRRLSKYLHLRNDQLNKPEEKRTYPNKELHPEFQPIENPLGFKFILMKQLETQEELLRALLDVEMHKLPKKELSKFMDKYGDLI